MHTEVFTQARSAKLYTDTPVDPAQIQALYDVAKWAPTESNTCPMRLLFIQSKDAKARLLPAIAAGNVAKVESAPVTAVVAFDTAFTEKLPVLAPHMPSPSYFDHMSAEAKAFSGYRSTHLQAGMLIAAARSMGLDCGPLAGFDRAAVDAEFFADSTWQTSFLLMLGVADTSQAYPRGPRLSFEKACQII